MPTVPSSRDVSAKEALECIRGPMTNAQIMERFKITPAGYADLLRQLFVKKLISEEDLLRRGIQFKVVEPPVAGRPGVPVPVIPRESYDNDDEFLDTVELTELLSFKPRVPKIKPDSEEESQREPTEKPQGKGRDTSRADESKRGKLGISTLFKRTW